MSLFVRYFSFSEMPASDYEYSGRNVFTSTKVLERVFDTFLPNYENIKCCIFLVFISYFPDIIYIPVKCILLFLDARYRNVSLNQFNYFPLEYGKDACQAFPSCRPKSSTSRNIYSIVFMLILVREL